MQCIAFTLLQLMLCIAGCGMYLLLFCKGFVADVETSSLGGDSMGFVFRDERLGDLGYGPLFVVLLFSEEMVHFK